MPRRVAQPAQTVQPPSHPAVDDELVLHLSLFQQDTLPVLNAAFFQQYSQMTVAEFFKKQCEERCELVKKEHELMVQDLKQQFQAAKQHIQRQGQQQSG